MINIQLDKDKIEAIKSLGGDIKRSLLKIAMKGILILEKEAKIQALSLRRSRSAGYKLQSGKLAQSITHTDPIIKGSVIESTIGSNRPYAKKQELGGVIVPRSKTFLTIPLSGMSPQPSAQLLKKSKRTFIAKDMIFLKDNTKKGYSPIYALKKSVTIPPQYWITKAEQKATPRIMELFNDIGSKEGTK